MNKLILILSAMMIGAFGLLAQDDTRLKEVKDALAMKDTNGWVSGAGLGFDFGQLLQINPAVGSGENRIGFGGVGSFFANYKKDRFAWDNAVDLLLGVQKLGSGYSTLNPNVKIPFQKSIDEFRIGSKAGFKTSETSKVYYSLLFTFLSQVTNTYNDLSAENPIKGNYLKDITGSGQGPVAKFLSPARITVSPGIDYKPNEDLSLFISPASLKMTIVASDAIAAIPARDNTGEPFGNVGLHGTEWLGPDDYKKVLTQFGATLNALYVKKLLEDKLTFKSGLTLFSNYLEKAKNVDVDWTTETGFMIWKGVQVTLNTRLFYDDDIPVQITNNNAVGGVTGLGKRVSFTEQFYLKYNYIF